MLNLIINKLKWYKIILFLILILAFFCTFWFQQIQYYENYVLGRLQDPVATQYIFRSWTWDNSLEKDPEKIVAKKLFSAIDLEDIKFPDNEFPTTLSKIRLSSIPGSFIELDTVPIEFLPTNINKTKWLNYKYTDLIVPLVLSKSISGPTGEGTKYKIGEKITIDYQSQPITFEVIGFGGQNFNKIPEEFLKRFPELAKPVKYYTFSNFIDLQEFMNRHKNGGLSGIGNDAISSGGQMQDIYGFTDYLREIGYWILAVSVLIIGFFGYQLFLYERKTLKIFYIIGTSDKQVKQFYTLYICSLFAFVFLTILLFYIGLNLSGLNLILENTRYEQYLSRFYYLK